MKNIDRLVYKILKDEIDKAGLIKELNDENALADIDVEDFENLRLLGFPICEDDDKVCLETAETPIENQTFCIVDIEASGSNPKENQIIEVGAVLIQNNQEIDTFESFVRANELPESISILTGITLDDLKDAPPLNFVLEQFRLFLKDAVFVAHNVNFDYNFISASLQQAGFGPLLNRKLCTIELSKKCFEAPRYGLGYLMEYFNKSFGNQHRALVDAQMADYVLRYCLGHLPHKITTTEELIALSRPIKRKKKKSKSPTNS